MNRHGERAAQAPMNSRRDTESDVVGAGVGVDVGLGVGVAVGVGVSTVMSSKGSPLPTVATAE